MVRQSSWPRFVVSPSLIAAGVTTTALVILGVVGVLDRVGGSRQFALAQAYSDVNAGALAVGPAQDVERRDPRRAEHWANYGVALGAAGYDVAAASALSEATRLDPSYPVFWQSLALELGLARNVTGAYAAAQHAIAADPWDHEALQIVAELALARGDPQTAAEKGALSVTLYPVNPSRYDAPVLADLTLQPLRRGRAAVGPSVQVRRHRGVRLRRAQLYAAAGRVPQALADLTVVLAKEPNNADALALQKQLQQR